MVGGVDMGAEPSLVRTAPRWIVQLPMLLGGLLSL